MASEDQGNHTLEQLIDEYGASYDMRSGSANMDTVKHWKEINTR